MVIIIHKWKIKHNLDNFNGTLFSQVSSINAKNVENTYNLDFQEGRKAFENSVKESPDMAVEVATEFMIQALAKAETSVANGDMTLDEGEFC